MDGRKDANRKRWGLKPEDTFLCANSIHMDIQKRAFVDGLHWVSDHPQWRQSWVEWKKYKKLKA